MGQIVERRSLNSFKNPVFVFDSDEGRHLRQRPHLLTDALARDVNDARCEKVAKSAVGVAFVVFVLVQRLREGSCHMGPILKSEDFNRRSVRAL